MSTYDPSGHPRLSAEAQALSVEVLDAYAEEAEALLGITGTTYSGRDALDLTTAVVRQVNLLVRLEQHGGGMLASESKGDQSVTFIRDARTGQAYHLDAIAQVIVARVTAKPASEVWPIAGGLR